MDTKAIEYVIAIAEEKSVTKAARRLFISQPALSQYIRKLETTLGVPLFEKDGRDLALSRAGEIFVAEGGEMLSILRQMKAKIAGLSDAGRAVIRFGISPFYSRFYLPLALPQFRTRHPNIRLEIVEEISVELERRTIEGDLDFCFVPKEPVNTALVYRIIFMEEIYIAVPPGHPCDQVVTPSTGIPFLQLRHLQGESFVMLKAQQKFRHLCDRMLESAEIQPVIAYETLNWDTVDVMVSHGMGVGFVPEVLLKRAAAGPRPKYYRIADTDARRAYAVAHLKERALQYPATELIDLLCESIAKI